MFKYELVKKISEQQECLYEQDIKRVLYTILDEISTGLENGQRIEIRGFGAFSVKYRESRMARNPSTGEQIVVNEKYTVVFKPAKELRDRINGKST